MKGFISRLRQPINFKVSFLSTLPTRQGSGARRAPGLLLYPKIFARVQNRSKLTAPAKQKGTGKGALLFGPEGFEPERQGLAWAELSTAAGGGGREKAPAQRSAKPSRVSGEG